MTITQTDIAILKHALGLTPLEDMPAYLKVKSIEKLVRKGIIVRDKKDVRVPRHKIEEVENILTNYWNKLKPQQPLEEVKGSDLVKGVIYRFNEVSKECGRYVGERIEGYMFFKPVITYGFKLAFDEFVIFPKDTEMMNEIFYLAPENKVKKYRLKHADLLLEVAPDKLEIGRVYCFDVMMDEMGVYCGIDKKRYCFKVIKCYSYPIDGDVVFFKKDQKFYENLY